MLDAARDTIYLTHYNMLQYSIDARNQAKSIILKEIFLKMINS